MFFVNHRGFSVGPFQTRDGAEHYARINARVPVLSITTTLPR